MTTTERGRQPSEAVIAPALTTSVDGSCLVLDFDGTILDTEQPVYQSWSELWRDHGLVLDRDRWKTIIGTNHGFDPWLELQRRVGPLDPALLEWRKVRRDELQSTYALRDGILSWLGEAEQLGLPVAIASSSPLEWVEGHLDRLGLARQFSVLVCCSESVPPKPDPTSFREACRRLGADPRRSVAVEDSSHGVAAAVAAGLFTVAVPHPLTEGTDLSAADILVPSLGALSLTALLAQARGGYTQRN